MDRQIIYYYKRGIASYLVAKKFGVSNSYVRDLLKKNGIKLRGHAVTNKVSAARRTPEENRQITAKASESNRGSEHTLMHRSRLALSRQMNPTIDPVYEKPIVELCKTLGLEIIPQKAFNRFNVDLYFIKKNVVLEIFGGGFHNKKDAVYLFNNKIRYLSKRKIPVVIVWADKLTYDPMSVIRVVAATREKLTVINGDGTPTTRGLGDIIL